MSRVGSLILAVLVFGGSVFLDDPDHYRKLADVPVAAKVHSIAADPTTHLVYTPEQEEGGKAVARMVVYATLPR